MFVNALMRFALQISEISNRRALEVKAANLKDDAKPAAPPGHLPHTTVGGIVLVAAVVAIGIGILIGSSVLAPTQQETQTSLIFF